MATPTQVYYWPRAFLLRSHDFSQPRSYRRAAISIIIAPRGDFAIEVEGLGALRCACLVIGPLSKRCGLELRGQDFADAAWLLDVAPGSTAHRMLLDWLQRRPARKLEGEVLQRVQARLQQHGQQEHLEMSQARELYQALVADILGEQPATACDARVLEVLCRLDQAALDEQAIAPLACQVGLSESRLRSLVRRELGCNLAAYARWSAAWKVMSRWHPGMTLTDAAHAAGFHDLAHANHAANDLFGLSPSRALDGQRVQLFADPAIGR